MPNDKVDKFLKTIAEIESSGGKNFEHKQIQSGIHEGHKAIGTYGLMPNTVDEIIKRSKKDDLQPILQLNPDEKKQYIESNPEIEERLAKYLAKHVLEKQQGDEQKAAYSWQYGHNLSPERVTEREYEKDPYVQKYKRYISTDKENNKLDYPLEVTDTSDINNILSYLGEEKQKTEELPKKQEDFINFKKLQQYLKPTPLMQPDEEKFELPPMDDTYLKKLLSRNKRLTK